MGLPMGAARRGVPQQRGRSWLQGWASCEEWGQAGQEGDVAHVDWESGSFRPCRVVVLATGVLDLAAGVQAEAGSVARVCSLWL